MSRWRVSFCFSLSKPKKMTTDFYCRCINVQATFITYLCFETVVLRYNHNKIFQYKHAIECSATI